MGKHGQVEAIFDEQARQTLSKLYDKVCMCRKYYEELDQLLDPQFHLEECYYRVLVERLDLEFA